MTEREIQESIERAQRLWLAAACKILAEVSGSVFEIAATSGAKSVRPLGVCSEFRVDGDIQGKISFGVPAESREFTTLISPEAGEGEGQFWETLSQKIGALWVEMLRDETGFACTLSLLKRGEEPGAGEVESAQTGKTKRRTSRQQAAKEGAAKDPAASAALFSTLESGKIKLPVYLTMETEKVNTPARKAAQHDAAGSAMETRPAQAKAENLDLLLDIELPASLRFGGREMPLEEILNLGPGDVVPLDRPIEAPVDLVVGDRIVARGEVVLVDGNYGLRVLEVAEPRKRLETVRCLF